MATRRKRYEIPNRRKIAEAHTEPSLVHEAVTRPPSREEASEVPFFDEGAVDRSMDETIEYAQGLRIIRKLAEGGMGTVYLAEQLGTAAFSKTVALKVIKRQWLRDKRALALFVSEARLVADLVHANICQVYSLNRYRGQLFIVMEYLHGLGLNRFLKAHTRSSYLPPPDYSAFIASRVTRGLEYAHTKKSRDGAPLAIVHRDVTPSNVILDFRGFVKLTDFGIALAITHKSIEGKGVVTGKISYMSPEQAHAEPVDYRSDIYSLGLVLYELLTGHKVFKARSVNEVRQQMKDRITPPHEVNPKVPEELSKICMKALRYDPMDRYQSAREFGNALEYFMYHDRWGPTNEKLASYLQKVFPNIERDKIL